LQLEHIVKVIEGFSAERIMPALPKLNIYETVVLSVVRMGESGRGRPRGRCWKINVAVWTVQRMDVLGSPSEEVILCPLEWRDGSMVMPSLDAGEQWFSM
jgi:hypothetical protein